MKTLRRLLLGLLSSLFLAAGLIRVAQSLDPLTRRSHHRPGAIGSVLPCCPPCDYPPVH